MVSKKNGVVENTNILSCYSTYSITKTPPLISNLEFTAAPIAFVATLNIYTPRAAALFSGRIHICTPISTIAASSMAGSLRCGVFSHICLFDCFSRFDLEVVAVVVFSQVTFIVISLQINPKI